MAPGTQPLYFDFTNKAQKTFLSPPGGQDLQQTYDAGAPGSQQIQLNTTQFAIQVLDVGGAGNGLTIPLLEVFDESVSPVFAATGLQCATPGLSANGVCVRNLFAIGIASSIGTGALPFVTVFAATHGSPTGASAKLEGSFVDGGTAIGCILNNTNALANAAAKLASFREGGTERFYMKRAELAVGIGTTNPQISFRQTGSNDTNAGMLWWNPSSSQGPSFYAISPDLNTTQSFFARRFTADTDYYLLKSGVNKGVIDWSNNTSGNTRFFVTQLGGIYASSTTTAQTDPQDASFTREAAGTWAMNSPGTNDAGTGPIVTATPAALRMYGLNTSPTVYERLSITYSGSTNGYLISPEQAGATVRPLSFGAAGAANLKIDGSGHVILNPGAGNPQLFFGGTAAGNPSLWQGNIKGLVTLLNIGGDLSVLYNFDANSYVMGGQAQLIKSPTAGLSVFVDSGGGSFDQETFRAEKSGTNNDTALMALVNIGGVQTFKRIVRDAGTGVLSMP